MNKQWIKRSAVWLCFCGIILIVVGVFYLSWIPNPQLTQVDWMPHWLGQWLDKFSRLRTGIPFVVLGGFAGFLLWVSNRKPSDWGLVFLLLICVVMTAELGQTSLSRRVVDWQDVAWGMLGSAFGLGIVKILGCAIGKRFLPSGSPNCRRKSSRD